MTRSRGFKAGFSLIELLLVMSLVPILFFSVYANFTTGLKIWTRVAQAVPEEDLVLFDIKARRELQNMLRLSTIPFEGGETEIAFAAAIEASPALGGERAIGRVRLSYDTGKKIIVRQTQDFSQIYREVPGSASVLLQNVTSCELSYLTTQPTQSGYAWNDFWKAEQGKLPVAVRISYSVDRVPGKHETVVLLPVGGKLS